MRWELLTDDYRDGGTLILQRPLGTTGGPSRTGDACLVNLHPPFYIGKRVPPLNQQYIVGPPSEAGFVAVSAPLGVASRTRGGSRTIMGTGWLRI